MTSPAIHIGGLRKSFGRTPVINGIDLDVFAGERHAIIGPNGAGKSTLFNLITGLAQPDAGDIRLGSASLVGLEPQSVARLGLSRSFQITNIFPRMSVFENIRCALLWSMGYGYSFWHVLARESSLNARAEQVLADIDLIDRSHLPAGELAYAEQRVLEIGISIAAGSKVVLLDEPCAGMSASEAKRCVELIHRISSNRTLLMIEHDMSVVFDLADRVSVLVDGCVLASDAPDAIRANTDVQKAYLGFRGAA